MPEMPDDHMGKFKWYVTKQPSSHLPKPPGLRSAKRAQWHQYVDLALRARPGRHGSATCPKCSRVRLQGMW